MRWHVQGVGNPRRDRTVTAGGSQSALRVRRIIVAMDQIVGDAGMLGIFLPQLFEDAQRLRVDWTTSCRSGWRSPPPAPPRRKRSAFQNRRDIDRKACASLFHTRPRDRAARLAHDKTARPRPSRAVRRAVIGIQRCDKLPLAIGAGLHRHGLVRCRFAGAHFVGSRRRPDRMPPRHGDSPLRHGTGWILGGDLGENPARLFVKKRVQQRDAASEFRLHRRRA